MTWIVTPQEFEELTKDASEEEKEYEYLGIKFRESSREGEQDNGI